MNIDLKIKYFIKMILINILIVLTIFTSFSFTFVSEVSATDSKQQGVDNTKYKEVVNNREPRLYFKKSDKDYLYIYLHDNSGVKTDQSYFIFEGKKHTVEFLEHDIGAYTEGKKRYEAFEKNQYTGKRFDYGLRIKNTDLSTEYKNIFVFSNDYWGGCFLKETFKIKKLEKRNAQGDYYQVDCAPRVTLKLVDGKPIIYSIDYSGIKSIKIIAEKTKETVYSYNISEKSTSKADSSNTKKEGYVLKDGIYYPITINDEVDMNVFKKAGVGNERYKIRVVAEDKNGIKNEKTMITRISTSNTEKVEKDTKKEEEQTSETTGDKLNVKSGTFTETYSGMKYYKVVPDNPTKNMPLIVFLHGVSEGKSFTKLGKLPIVTYVKSKKAFQAGKFIFIAPQSTDNSWYKTKTQKKLINLIDKISSEYKIDKKRIILTGMSRGAHGTWVTASNYPNYFAAIVPMSSAAGAEVKKLVNMPIWAIAGNKNSSNIKEKDINERMKKLVNKINKASGKNLAKFETIDGARHGTVQNAYKRVELFKWMLSQKKE